METPSKEILDIKKEIKVLKKKNLVLGILNIVVISVLFYSFTSNKFNDQKEIITERLVVVDSAGSPRIVISSAIKNIEGRKESFALGGVLVLDENGTDRVIMGATPFVKIEDQIVKRVHDDVSYGVHFNDNLGGERGGFGFYDKRKLATFGLDYNGHEALNMFAAEDNYYGIKTGIVMQLPREQGENMKQSIFIGSDTDGASVFKLSSPGKADLRLMIDSTANAELSYYDYQLNKLDNLISKTHLNN
jgi:hypothetical protein